MPLPRPDLALAVGLCLLADGLGPGLAGPRRGRAVAALAVAGIALVLPWTLPADAVFLRAVVTLLALVSLFRVVDLARDPRPHGLGTRLAMVYGLVDARSAVPRPGHRPPADAVLRAVGFGLPFAAGIVVGTGPLASPDDPTLGALRVAVGLATFYAGVETAIALIRIVYAVAGYSPGTLHRDPILSRTLGEFWSRRWNLTVARWLDRHAFRPLARRSEPNAGRLAAFGASALAHAYFALVPLGPGMAARMGAFFLAQGALVALEPALGVPRWNPAAQRTWTILAFALTGSLIAEPTLRILANAR